LGIEKKLEIGAINITTQPHSAENYVKLFRAATKIREPVKIRGDRYGIFSGFHRERLPDAKVKPISGDIVLFTDIDRSAPWFNTNSNDFASDSEVDEVNIPEYLKPNSVKFAYVFFPDEHLAFFQGYDSSTGKTLTSNVARTFFERVLGRDMLREQFGVVDVTSIPTEDAVKTALAVSQKSRMHLTMTVPNPDDHKEEEKEVQDRLKTLNARKKEEIYYSEAGEALEVDEELRIQAVIAARNGSVVVTGKDEDGKPVRINTEQHPWRFKDYFDEGVEAMFEVLLRVASEFRKKL